MNYSFPTQEKGHQRTAEKKPRGAQNALKKSKITSLKIRMMPNEPCE